jgi:CheY-like chemotaxis protein
VSDRRVLVVEDDQASQDILTSLLKHRQFDFDVADSGEMALDLLSQNTYVMAILDLALPRMDGWELLKAIRADAYTANLRVVAVTAFYDSGLARLAKQAGFQACFPKPATLALVQDLEAILQ